MANTVGYNCSFISIVWLPNLYLHCSILICWRPVPFNEYKKCILKFIEENNSRTSFPLRQPLPHTTRQYFVNAAAKSSLTSKQQPQLAIPGVATDGVDDEGNTSGTFSLYTQAFFDMERLILNSTADRAVPEPESPKKRKRSRLVKYTQIGMRFLRPGHCGIVDRPDESWKKFTINKKTHRAFAFYFFLL